MPREGRFAFYKKDIGRLSTLVVCDCYRELGRAEPDAKQIVHHA
jgi:hypothetical protein